MDKDEQRQQRMLYDQPTEKWPQFAVAMAWRDRDTEPPWMNLDERAWFWRTVDYERAQAQKLAEWDASWAALKEALIAPFIPIVDWLARRLPK